MPKKKKSCVQRKVAVVMRERKRRNEPRKQRIAIALSVARKHCGVARRK